MDDLDELARHLLSAAQSVADEIGAARVLAFLDALPEDPAIDSQTILVTRDGKDGERAERLLEQTGATHLSIPDVNLDREGQINLAALLALSTDLVSKGETIVALVGAMGHTIDTLQVVQPEDRLSLIGAMGKGRSKRAVRRAVFQQVISLALALSSEGREGKTVGGLFVVGDTEKVDDHTEQLIMNPFRGYPEEVRSILDARMAETVKEFSTIDGAFVIRGDGIVMSAGTLIRASLMDEDLPKGLGARHAAAAGITRITKALAVTVSQSDGTVRIWRNGKIVTSLERE